MFFSFKLLLKDQALFGLLVDYCDVLISCLGSHSDGTHSLQSIPPNLYLGWPECEYILSKFWLNYSFNFSHSRSRANLSCIRASVPLSRKPVPSMPSLKCCAGSRGRKTVCLSDTLQNTPPPLTPVRALKEVRVQLNQMYDLLVIYKIPFICWPFALIWFGFRCTLTWPTRCDLTAKKAARASLHSHLTQFSNTIEMIQPKDPNLPWVNNLCKAAAFFSILQLTIWQTHLGLDLILCEGKKTHFVNLLFQNSFS